MKKLLFGSIILVGIGYIGVHHFFVSKKFVSEKKETTKHFADVRLSLNKITKEIELKIAFMLEDLTQNKAKINDNELESIIRKLQRIRAYGKDISKEAKINLLKIIKVLASKHYPNKALLLKLLDIAQSSQKLTA